MQKGDKTKSKKAKAKPKAVIKKVEVEEEQDIHEGGEEEQLEEDEEVEVPMKRPASRASMVKAESSKAKAKSSVEPPRQSRPPIVQPPILGPSARETPSTPVGEENTQQVGQGNQEQPTSPTAEELAKEMEKDLEQDTMVDTKVDSVSQPVVLAEPVVAPEATPTEPPTELYHAPDPSKSPEPAAALQSASPAAADPPLKRARTCEESQWFPVMATSFFWIGQFLP